MAQLTMDRAAEPPDPAGTQLFPQDAEPPETPAPKTHSPHIQGTAVGGGLEGGSTAWGCRTKAHDLGGDSSVTISLSLWSSRQCREWDAEPKGACNSSEDRAAGVGGWLHTGCAAQTPLHLSRVGGQQCQRRVSPHSAGSVACTMLSPKWAGHGAQGLRTEHPRERHALKGGSSHSSEAGG